MGKYKQNGRMCGFSWGCGCRCCGGGPAGRLCLTLFNIIFLCAGVTLLVLGLWSKSEKKMVSLNDLVDTGLDDNIVSTAGWIVIGFGGFVAIVSGLGCPAVCCSKGKGLLALYGCLLIVIFCCGIAAAAVIGVFKGKIDDELSGALTKSLVKYQPGNDIATDWDYVQTWMGCCGSNGPKDYSNISFADKKMHVPITCCVLTNSDAEKPNPQNETECQLDAYRFLFGNLTSSEALQTDGCFDSLGNHTDSYLGVVIGVGVALSTLQMIAICMAIGLCKGDGNSYESL